MEALEEEVGLPPAPAQAAEDDDDDDYGGGGTDPGDEPSLQLVGSYPEKDSDDFPIYEKIKLYFNMPIELVDEEKYADLVYLTPASDPGDSVYLDVYVDNDEDYMLVIAPPYWLPLEYDTKYTLIVKERAVKDVENKGYYNNEIKLTFTTEKDLVPPQVYFSYPDPEYDDPVIIHSPIELQFSEALDVDKIDKNAIKLTRLDENNEQVNVDFELLVEEDEALTSILFIKPINEHVQGEFFKYDTTYTLTLEEGAVKDLAGNANEVFTLTFTTAGWQSLISTGSYPPDGSEGLLHVSGWIRVFFNLPIELAQSGGITLVAENDPDTEISCTAEVWYYLSNTLEIEPDEKLQYGTKYILTLDGGVVRDIADKANINPEIILTFTTETN